MLRRLRGDDSGIKQTSLASAEYAGKKKTTRRERFLGEMNTVVPWSRLEALIEPHYPQSGKVGRPPIGLPRMLRMYFLQQWYTLADEALEDALYDSRSIARPIEKLVLHQCVRSQRGTRSLCPLKGNHHVQASAIAN